MLLFYPAGYNRNDSANDATPVERSGQLSCRKEALNILKQVQNGLYLIEDGPVLDEVVATLTELDDKIYRHIPTADDLPIRRKRRLMKKGMFHIEI